MNPGDELLPIGKLSRQQHIGKSTIAKAYGELERMGIIQSIQPERFIINNLSEDEIKKLADQKKLKNISQEEQEKLNAELEAARQIQKGLLPNELPKNDIISVAAYSTLSKDVGGDFYDFFKITDELYGILIGDASGNGLPAAMLISQIQAIIKSDISFKRSIQQTLELLNAYLKSYSAAKNFATLFYGIYDLDSGSLTYANAGHNFPMIFRHSGGIESLKTTGPALGIMENAEYEVRTTHIEPKEILFLFTDGLPETMDSNGNQFGEERIEKFCSVNRAKSSNQIIEGMRNSLNQFNKQQNDVDDTTFLVVKRNDKLNKR